MAKIIDLPTFGDDRGMLTVIEKVFQGDIKRVYYIYGADDKPRGGHRHKRTQQILVALHGECEVYCETPESSNNFLLNSPAKGLLVEAADWHTMQNFSKDCVLLVLASEYYDMEDYVDERY
jgi:dTDP-4-dehydrorhamnose 3,5-epimerase-like enzyme